MTSGECVAATHSMVHTVRFCHISAHSWCFTPELPLATCLHLVSPAERQVQTLFLIENDLWLQNR